MRSVFVKTSLEMTVGVPIEIQAVFLVILVGPFTGTTIWLRFSHDTMLAAVGSPLALEVAPLLIGGFGEAWKRTVGIGLLPPLQEQLESRVLSFVPQTECCLMGANRSRVEHILDWARLFLLLGRRFLFLQLLLDLLKPLLEVLGKGLELALRLK